MIWLMMPTPGMAKKVIWSIIIPFFLRKRNAKSYNRFWRS